MKQIPHYDRYPDYGISTRDIASNGTAKKLLTYAAFKDCPFTRNDFQNFRVRTDISKDMFVRAMQKLISFGWIVQNDDVYQITASGKDAMSRITARDSLRRDMQMNRQMRSKKS